jgi:signal transduction histidine kinase
MKKTKKELEQEHEIEQLKKRITDYEEYIERQITHIIGVITHVALGDLSVRAEHEREDDLGALALGVNMMIDEIKKRTAKLETRSKKLADARKALLNILEDVTQTKNQLDVAYAALKQADQMKSDFMNMAAHELRTPLTPLKGYVEMLLEGTMGRITSAQKSALEMIAKSVERAIHLINSLLNVSRIETGKMTFVFQPVSVYELVNDAVVNVQSMVAEAGHSLTVNVPKGLLYVNGDRAMLTNVVENLLVNAVKYTERGGKITIEAFDEGDNVHLTVSDTGIGIPEEEQEKIFDKFYQVSRGNSRWAKGIGIGLYVAKYVMEKHNGKIWVESEVGKGSVFHVLFPIFKKEKMSDEK